ncbi:hypothetical protein INR49_002737 [Caranx melampygus]|nr:hypothetical protein INR49_002737 [Caranx melampygus]
MELDTTSCRKAAAESGGWREEEKEEGEEEEEEEDAFTEVPCGFSRHLLPPLPIYTPPPSTTPPAPLPSRSLVWQTGSLLGSASKWQPLPGSPEGPGDKQWCGSLDMRGQDMKRPSLRDVAPALSRLVWGFVQTCLVKVSPNITTVNDFTPRTSQ